LTDDLSQHLLILGSEDRLTLLARIDRERLRLTSLAKIIHASNQECSRHLSRLADSSLVKKDSAGFYETTPLGRGVLGLLPSLRFLVKHRNYVLSHDLSLLPGPFMERIGELVEGRLVGHFNIVLEHIKKTIAEAREHLWLISDQPIIPTSSLGVGFPSRNLPVRLILQPGYDLKTFVEAKSALPIEFEIGLAQQVRVAMAINEKVAGICFPGLDGRLDFGVGFIGSDLQFRTWASDLFEHYWKNSQRVTF
jgi:predicted transcriptional regulator